MKRIKIKQNTLGDTRTATKVPTFYEFIDSNSSHATDVSNMMDYIAEKIQHKIKDDGKHCGNCDAKIKYDYKFCPYCGRVIK